MILLNDFKGSVNQREVIFTILDQFTIIIENRIWVFLLKGNIYILIFLVRSKPGFYSAKTPIGSRVPLHRCTCIVSPFFIGNGDKCIKVFTFVFPILIGVLYFNIIKLFYAIDLIIDHAQFISLIYIRSSPHSHQ